jgi:hypothetical protein
MRYAPISRRQTEPSRDRAGRSKGHEKPSDSGRPEQSCARSKVVSSVFHQGAGEAQESTKGWIVIVRQPCSAELEQLIISRDWSEHYLWKGRRGCRFGRKTDAEAHRHQVHQGVATNIELLHGAAIRIGVPSSEPVAECTVVLGLTYNQVFFAEIRPFDLLPFT